jgi:hypothetical protein
MRHIKSYVLSEAGTFLGGDKLGRYNGVTLAIARLEPPTGAPTTLDVGYQFKVKFKQSSMLKQYVEYLDPSNKGADELPLIATRLFRNVDLPLMLMGIGKSVTFGIKETAEGSLLDFLEGLDFDGGKLQHSGLEDFDTLSLTGIEFADYDMKAGGWKFGMPYFVEVVLSMDVPEGSEQKLSGWHTLLRPHLMSFVDTHSLFSTGNKYWEVV